MTILAALIVILLVAFPTSLVGKVLRNLLVDAPARRLNRITPARLAFFLCLGATGLILFGLFEVEGLRLFSLMAPELLVWFTAFDVALILDVFLIGIALAATNQVRTIRAAVLQKLHHLRTVSVTRGFARSRATKLSPSVSKVIPKDPDPLGYAVA